MNVIHKHQNFEMSHDYLSPTRQRSTFLILKFAHFSKNLPVCFYFGGHALTEACWSEEAFISHVKWAMIFSLVAV